MLLVGCIYRSSSGTDINNERLLNLLSEINGMKYSHILLMGDFNFEKINWCDWSTPSNETQIDFQFIEKLRDCFLQQHVTKPTRARIDKEPHILDLVLTNEEGMISNMEYYSPLGKSDHSVLHFKFNCYIQQENTERIKYYYDKADFTVMKQELAEVNWTRKLHGKNINDQWNTFKDILLKVQDKHVPKRTPRPFSERKGKTNLDLKTIKAIRKKHRCWTRFMETKDGLRYKEYCRARNQVKSLTRNAVRNKEKEIVKDIKQNPKKFWQYTQSKTKVRTGISDLVMNIDNGKEVLTENDSDKATYVIKIFLKCLHDRGL